MAFSHRYLPVTEQDEAHMLQTIGVASIEELLADIPSSIRLNRPLNLDPALSEPELMRHARALATQNADLETFPSFLGAGMYDHDRPALIGQLLLRGEFFTAYTPYQPELAQGGLQAMFEFQSYMCALTGMSVANASLYDGATAVAEAGFLACQATQRKRLLLSEAIHPHAKAVTRTVAKGLGTEVVEVPLRDGLLDLDRLEQLCDDRCAAVIVQTPHFYGGIEDVRAIAARAHAHGALCVVSANPLALALLEAPGHLGADVVVGDAQPFGIPPAFGGPSCGFFAVNEAHLRRLPGRLVGQTVDRDGKRGFVLTLQAREQHIRREKATSNICSNQALLALCAAMYVSVMGKQGIQEVAQQCVQKAHYLKTQLCRIPGVTTINDAPTFHEFAVRLPRPDAVPATQTTAAWVQRQLFDRNIIGGYDLGKRSPDQSDHMLFAVTERRTREQLDALLHHMEDILR